MFISLEAFRLTRVKKNRQNRERKKKEQLFIGKKPSREWLNEGQMKK